MGRVAVALYGSAANGGLLATISLLRGINFVLFPLRRRWTSSPLILVASTILCARRLSGDGRRAFVFSGTITLMQKTIKTLEELAQEAAHFINTLMPKADGATLVTLSGELGAGKTAFTKEAAKSLGIEETITSPTFVLEKIYMLPTGAVFKRLIHIDAYRLEKGSDLVPLGFDELMKDASSLVFLEWPEKVSGALPVPAVQISLVVQPDNSRIISYG